MHRWCWRSIKKNMMEQAIKLVGDLGFMSGKVK